MKLIHRFSPLMCVLVLLGATLACALPESSHESDVDVAITQTLQSLATSVAKTSEVLNLEATEPVEKPTMGKPEDTPEMDDPPPPSRTPSPIPSRPTQTPSTGKIMGILWQDNNEDGVMDPCEPPLPDAAVLLGEGPCDSVGFMSTTTADDGIFTFEDLLGGVYCVNVLLPHGCGGFSPTTEHPLTVILPGLDAQELLLGFLENPCPE